MSDDNSHSSDTSGKKGFFSLLLNQLFHGEPKNREELLTLIRDSEQNELIDQDTRDMLEGVMDIADQRVRDIMWFKAELAPNIQFFVSSMLCLGLFTAARVCEQIRAAIQSLPRGQRSAALAMGLTLPQTYRYVLLPNALRVVIPPMTSEMMNMVKNSAIASTIGLADMAAQAGKLLDYSAHAWESFTAITLAYVCINALIMGMMHIIERKARLPGNIGGGN